MADALTPSRSSFLQDLYPWAAADGDRPGARPLVTMCVVVVRWIADSRAAQAAFAEAGMGWPEHDLELRSMNGWLATRRHGKEVIVVGDNAPTMQQLLAAMAPGREPDSMALELTQGTGVIELRGPELADWLSRLVDRASLPDEGRASRCRLVDVPVLLLRPARDCILLIADRSLFPYLARWLAFAHEGTFN